MKILAVDDIPMNLVLIKAFMKKSGAVLELANGGQEAVEKTKKVKYDLILMDHMMPEIDGIQALGMIKNDDENLNKDTKVIMLTANAIEGADQEYLKEGFVDYLSKPFEATVFESMIKKHI